MTTELTTQALTAESSHHPLPAPDTPDDDPSQKPYRSSSKQRPFGNGNSNSNSNSKRKPQTKNKKKKQPYKPAYLDTIQQEIDDLKKELMTQDTESDVKSESEDRQSTSKVISKLEALKLKLSTPEMLQKSLLDRAHSARNTQQSKELTARFEQETLTLLHFFYIVRLAQKGFFDAISQSYPEVEPGALIHLCDRLVGGSLFVVKDPAEQVRSDKRIQVFDLLQKLHDGVAEPIDDGYSTTFKQVRHLVFDFIESTTPSITQQDDDQLARYQNLQHPQQGHSIKGNQQGQSPLWVMVPFHGMVDGPLFQGTASTPIFQQKPKEASSLDNNGEKADVKTTVGSHDSTTSPHKVSSDKHKSGEPAEPPKETKPSLSNKAPDDFKTKDEYNTGDMHSTTDTPSSDLEHLTPAKTAALSDHSTGETSSGWASTLATTPSSSSWSQGNDRKPDDTTDDIMNDGWGSPPLDNTPTDPPAWGGKLPEELVIPGDETISGDVLDRPWQTTDQGSRRGGRGRPSGFRGRGGSYRPSYEGFRGRGRGGPRRGGGPGWNTDRPPRPE